MESLQKSFVRVDKEEKKLQEEQTNLCKSIDEFARFVKSDTWADKCDKEAANAFIKKMKKIQLEPATNRAEACASCAMPEVPHCLNKVADELKKESDEIRSASNDLGQERKAFGTIIYLKMKRLGFFDFLD